MAQAGLHVFGLGNRAAWSSSQGYSYSLKLEAIKLSDSGQEIVFWITGFSLLHLPQNIYFLPNIAQDWAQAIWVCILCAYCYYKPKKDPVWWEWTLDDWPLTNYHHLIMIHFPIACHLSPADHKSLSPCGAAQRNSCLIWPSNGAAWLTYTLCLPFASPNAVTGLRSTTWIDTSHGVHCGLLPHHSTRMDGGHQRSHGW